MKSIQARLAAVAASFIIATLGAWGVSGVGPELAGQLEAWLAHTFEVLLLLGYAVLHPWLQRRLNPLGAYSQAATDRLERAAAHAAADTQ